MSIPPNIFREYDIRGVAETELSSPRVEALGRAIGTFLKEKGCVKIALGKDCRTSSDRIAKHLTQGLLATGSDVIDVGWVPTPVLYFSVVNLGLHGGIMITGSHNPPQYNGIKICIGAQTLYGEQIQEIKKILLVDHFASGQGTKTNLDIREKYIEHVVRDIRKPMSLKVVVDSGNGMAGPIAPEIFRRLGCKVFSLYETPDGNFPNHHPDPTVLDNLVSLRNKVLETSAIVGIGFDGDADRIGVIDRSGTMIYGDELLILYSRQVLEKHPGAKIISEVKASNRLFNDIRKHGGTPILWKTGHSLIKAKMKEVGALLAGEMSGHMFFADRYYGFDDAIYAGARLFEIIATCGKSPCELLADVPQSCTTPEIRADCPDETKFQVISNTRDALKKRGYRINDIDGVRVEFDDGWGLVRASNTQPVLVYRFEAATRARLNEIRSLIEKTVAGFL